MLKPRCDVSPPDAPGAFRTALVQWFRKHGRDYPWRRTHDPYAVLVSEVMLQQTQIATVLGKGFYTRFLAAFPDVHALAAADDITLLKAWEGLGYYRRARMLRETARVVASEHRGVFPEDADALQRLPGVGRYTAGALRAFAFGKDAVLVDGNVARVLARLMDFHEMVDDGPGQRRIWEWAAILADPRRPREYHAALMELGQTCCRPGVPDCQACPVARFCTSAEPSRLPIKKGRAAPTAVEEHALWLRDADGNLLLHRESGGRRTGLWKLPLREASALGCLPLIATHRYAITRYKVTLRVHDGSRAPARVIGPTAGDAWHPPDALSSLPMAAPFRKVVEALIQDF